MSMADEFNTSFNEEEIASNEIKDSNALVTQENRHQQPEAVQDALCDLLVVDEEPVIDEITDRRVLTEMASAEYVTGTQTQRILDNPNIVPNDIPNNLPVVIKPKQEGEEESIEDVVEKIWMRLVNSRADMRFCAAVEVCSSKVGTVPEAVEYLKLCFPILKTYNFTDQHFCALIDTVPQVAEAWGFGVFGDEAGDRLMVDLAKRVALDNYYKGELTVTELHRYGQLRDTLEGIKDRRELTNARVAQMRGLTNQYNSEPTQITFQITKRDGDAGE